jgi:hypothetical protein
MHRPEPLSPRPEATTASGQRSLWVTYAGLCVLCWGLYAMAGTDWQRGGWRVWEGVYEATLNLSAPMLAGLLTLPWVRWLHSMRPAPLLLAGLHVLGAATFIVLWLALELGLAWALFGGDHARALLEQRVLWRAVWGVFVYLALIFGFGGALHARRAQQAAVSAARAEAALVRAELAAINGKLNPHFLFNTLNSLLMLTRRDPAAAEDALLRFARMMRHVLDSTRASHDRIALRQELDFVRDYLALEGLRLGDRLRVRWELDEAVLDDAIPPLTLQPLVENAVQHGLAPQVGGGELLVLAERQGELLRLVVRDDGAGCTWPAVPSGPGRGVGLSALQRRFALDYDGRARLNVRTAIGAGFEVEVLIPQET